MSLPEEAGENPFCVEMIQLGQPVEEDTSVSPKELHKDEPTKSIEVVEVQEASTEAPPSGPPLVSKIRLLLLAVSILGTQLICKYTSELMKSNSYPRLSTLLIMSFYIGSLQNGNASAFFIELGLEEKWIGIAWLASGIAGVLAQQLVGQFSDK
jgi:hypothetical protein